MFELRDKKFTARQYIENYLWIVDKKRKKVPFVLNNIQNLLFEHQTHRDLVLKPRKPGVSSFILAEWLIACILEDNTQAVVISHEKGATQKLLARVYYYLDTMAIRPKTSRESANEISFPETKSSFYIGTAGSKAFGRGSDITHLHVSEFDWWENADMLTGVLEACVPDAHIVVETTANGFGSQFHKLWQASRNNQSEFKCHFFGWYDDEENTRPLEKPLVLTKEEKDLKKAYNLTDERINWRRWKLRTMAKPELFPQEFPANETEAFLFSGRMFFNTERLRVYEANCIEAIDHGELAKRNDKVEFLPSESGSLRIYERPKPGHHYVIGGDVAEGLGQDFSTATVIDKSTGNTVATMKQDVDPSTWGYELAKLGQFYNWAFMAVESNNHGLTSLTVLKDTWKYPNNLIYYSRTIDKATNQETDRIGFRTNDATRPLILDNLYNQIIEGTIGIKAKEIISEMMSFVINKNGKAEAQPGGNDDFVMSTAIGYYVRPFARMMVAPVEVPHGRKQKNPLDDYDPLA
jgi:hypothetical protein